MSGFLQSHWHSSLWVSTPRTIALKRWRPTIDCSGTSPIVCGKGVGASFGLPKDVPWGAGRRFRTAPLAQDAKRPRITAREPHLQNSAESRGVPLGFTLEQLKSCHLYFDPSTLSVFGGWTPEGTTRLEGQVLQLLDLESDSHRVRGPESSKWAPGTYVGGRVMDPSRRCVPREPVGYSCPPASSKFCREIPQGDPAKLRLPPERYIGPYACVSQTIVGLKARGTLSSLLFGSIDIMHVWEMMTNFWI